MHKLLQVFTLCTLIFVVLSCGPSTENNVNQPAQKEAVRGVWMTNVASEVLHSRGNIVEAVKLLDSLGFNTIFLVTWNRGNTIYQSDIMKNFTGRSIDPKYGDRDPLQEVIEEAHKRDIKVFAWFEFGFASSYGDDTGGALIQQKPEWASKDINGDITTKNKFQWMNALHPEVQDFITSLVLEVVNKYEVDGVQGDDRLPAMPSNGGYDEFTVELYKSEHSGNEPPVNHLDFEWVSWRAQKLNEFLKVLYTSVKQADPTCLVSMSPSVYPWSKENYLQDWPTWVRQGYVDLVCPQLYRYDIDAYNQLLEEITSWQLADSDLPIFYPGVLLQVDKYNPTEDMLRAMIESNRAYGVNGEVFFFYEGVKKFKGLFSEMYAEPVVFPDLAKKK